MNPDRDFDRLLDEWFAEGPREAADRVVMNVADRIEHQPQRTAWRLHWKDLHMTTPVRAAASIAAVLVLAVGAYAVIQRPGPSGGGTGSTPSPTPLITPSVTDTVNALPSGFGSLHAVNFDVPLSLTFSADWTIEAIGKSLVDLRRDDGSDFGISPMALVTLPGATLSDPWIPVPTDFVAWVNQRQEFAHAASRTVTIAGRSGTLVDADFVWKDGTPARDFLRYGTGAWLYDQYDAGGRVRFVILPGPSGVGGLVMVLNAGAADFEAAATSLDAVLATLQIDPAP